MYVVYKTTRLQPYLVEMLKAWELNQIDLVSSEGQLCR